MCKKKLIEQFERELKLSKAKATVKVYLKQFYLFLDYFDGQDLRYISLDKLKDYILFLHNIYGYSAIIHAISAIKFYYLKVNGRKRIINIDLPKKPKTIPVFLNIEEIKGMINGTLNLKHRVILEVLFYHGLRRSELLNLKISEIDSANMILRVIQSKGCKDRNIPLSEECLKTLREYYRAFKPEIYLFNGDNKGEQYSPTSLSKVVKAAAKRAGINKNVTPHTLRHSFASYLAGIGVNLKYIQEWLGHNSSRTTEIYVHLNTVNNPIKLTA